jgi:hypothetical protein
MTVDNSAPVYKPEDSYRQLVFCLLLCGMRLDVLALIYKGGLGPSKHN